MSDDVQIESLIESDNFGASVSHEPDGETMYHLDLGFVTVHLFKEEWDEFVELVRAAADEVSKTAK